MASTLQVLTQCEVTVHMIIGEQNYLAKTRQTVVLPRAELTVYCCHDICFAAWVCENESESMINAYQYYSSASESGLLSRDLKFVFAPNTHRAKTAHGHGPMGNVIWLKSLLVKWLEQATQWHEMYCHDHVLSGGHEFECWSGRTWGALYFCPKLYLIQKYNSYNVACYVHILSMCDIDKIQPDSLISISVFAVTPYMPTLYNSDLWLIVESHWLRNCCCWYRVNTFVKLLHRGPGFKSWVVVISWSKTSYIN